MEPVRATCYLHFIEHASACALIAPNIPRRIFYRYGFNYHCLELLIYLLYLLFWTLSAAFGRYHGGSGSNDRNDFTDTRITIDTLAMLMFIYMVYKEVWPREKRVVVC